MTPRVGVIGCGGMGERWATMLLSEGIVPSLRDVDHEKADVLRGALRGVWRKEIDVKRWNDDNDNWDVAIIATPNRYLAPLAHESLDKGRHVLVEKPGAISAEELRSVIAHARGSMRAFRVNYLLRTHPAGMEILRILRNGDLGPFMNMRAVYGHGGRPGYAKEWRMQREESGGGVAIDLGAHLIDFAISAIGTTDAGPWSSGSCVLSRTYWRESTCEDNAFITLENAHHTASLHVSATEWVNKFDMEIFCQRGKLHWRGVGGSYGEEELFLHKQEKDGVRPTTVRLPETGEWISSDVGSFALKTMWKEFMKECASPGYDGGRNNRRAFEVLTTLEKVSKTYGKR
jgi:predicted dehydrogenase